MTNDHWDMANCQGINGRDMKQEIYGKKTNMTHLIFFNKNYNRQLDVFESGLKKIDFSRR